MALLLERSILSKSMIFVYILVQQVRYGDPLRSHDTVITARKNTELKVYLG